jgi:preprotein translocase subunit SecE
VDSDPINPDSPTSDQPKPPVEQSVLAEPSAVVPEGFAAATLAELRKVVWPSRQQLFSESVAVILMVSLSAAAIAAIDRFYGWAALQVFR